MVIRSTPPDVINQVIYMLAMGYTIKATMRTVHLCYDTVTAIKTDNLSKIQELQKQNEQQILENYKDFFKDFSNTLKEIAVRIAKAITPEDIAKAGLSQKTLSLGILTDKSLLLDGRPTQITKSEPSQLSKEELIKDILFFTDTKPEGEKLSTGEIAETPKNEVIPEITPKS